VLSVWPTFLMLLLCLGYVAPMGVSLACTMSCFYGSNYATACVCLYDTSLLASKIHQWATRSCEAGVVLVSGLSGVFGDVWIACVVVL
jgi:hypothetical protein